MFIFQRHSLSLKKNKIGLWPYTESIRSSCLKKSSREWDAIVIPRTYLCNVIILPHHRCATFESLRKEEEVERARTRTGVYRVQGVFLSGAISMGIGATLCLTVSYLKYIFVDGTFIDVDADMPLSAAIDNIFPVSRREASFPVASSMKKPASQSQPTLLPFASAYSLLTACFMPLYTWLNVYRHRIPTGSALVVSLILLLFLATTSFRFLFLSPLQSLFRLSSPTSSATASSSSKSSASSYQSCDLIDRITSLPLDSFCLCSLTLSHSLSLSLSLFRFLLLSFYICPRHLSYLARSMSCNAITTVSLMYSKIWVTIQLRAKVNEKEGVRNRQISLNIQTSACQFGFYAATASEYLRNIAQVDVFSESA